jgi:general secretion pathway protein L
MDSKLIISGAYMSGRILGVDINEDYISVVQVISGLKGSQVLSCLSVMINGDNGPSAALKELFEKIDLKGNTCIASIGGGNISCRNLVMPFKDPKKIKQTLPFELETLIPFPVDDIVIDFNIINNADQSEIIALYAKKTEISEYLEILKPSGISPEIIDIRPAPVALWLLSRDETPGSGFVIDIGLKQITMVLFNDRRIALIRNMPLGDGCVSISDLKDISSISKERVKAVLGSMQTCIKNTLRSFSMQSGTDFKPEKTFLTGIGALYPGIVELMAEEPGIPVEKINITRDAGIRMDYNIETGWNPALMDGALSLVLRDAKKGYGFNLLKGDFEVKKGFLKTIKDLQRIGIAVLGILIFLMMDFGVDYYLVKKRYDAAEKRCADLFKQSFPDSGNVKYPLLQMKQKIEELKKSAVMLPGDIRRDQKVLDIVNSISGSIPAGVDIDVASMVIDTEAVRISGETDSFNTVNSLESGLESSPYFSDVTINKAEHDRTGKKVEFELKLQRK